MSQTTEPDTRDNIHPVHYANGIHRIVAAPRRTGKSTRQFVIIGGVGLVVHGDVRGPSIARMERRTADFVYSGGHLSRTLHVGCTHDWDRSPMVAAVLSPHLDDAALSCWRVLTQPGEVIVINVFAGVPTNMGAFAWWDRLTGASDSGERVRERLEEDRNALALAGRTPVNLGFLDQQYRDAEQSLASVAAEIEGRLTPDVHVFAPAAFGGHPDHALVRAAALELGRRGFEVSLYADLPHATFQGWPAWVTGADAAGSVDLAETSWDRTLAETGVSPAAMSREAHKLDPHSHARKLEAVHAYVTQVHGLAEFGGRPLTDRETLGYEVVWKLPSPATPSPAPAPRRATPRP